VRNWLRREHGVPKAALRPIYDALATVIDQLGDDVTVEGRGTYTPFVRGRQFAAIAAAARDRVDLGLRFTDPPQAARSRAAGPGRPRTRCRCGKRARSTPRSCSYCGWPTSRTPDPAAR
jgi:Domain of unknown function (DUF5655)